jgi:putative oxidoreductase
MNRLFAPFVAGKGAYGLLALRILVGIAFMLHGWPKIQNPTGWMGPDAPVPGFLQFLAAFSEFFGGMAILVGLLTPIAALGIFFTMLVAAKTHMDKGGQFVGGEGSYEMAAVYAAIMVMFMLVGPGRLSLDYLVFGKRREEAGTENVLRPKVA